MNTITTPVKVMAVGLLAGLVGGCATVPNPDVVQAEQYYNQIKSDPEVVAKAPVAMMEAEESLNELKRMDDKGEDDATLKRLAYHTQLKTQIARAKADTAIAQNLIAKAEAERKQVLIDARTLEADTRAQQADAARQRAKQALTEAEAARKQAEEERLKAEELAKQLADLQARQTDRGMVLTMGDVLFDYNKADVKSAGMHVIEKLTDFLEKHPERNIQVEGHTDSTGSDEYNLKLSERRADAVKRALVHAGIAPERIKAIGYGEEYPIASNDTSSGQQQNRRVEIVISDEKGVVTKR
ncbi:MAG: OmpA family protein [Gammaproteobacteria bacterium]